MFLTDFSGNASLINRLLGANTPEKRVDIGLAFDVLTLILSALLLIFLFGYFDGRYTRTGEATPPIVYLVYLFLGLVAIWQSLSLVVGIMHKGKLSGRKGSAASADSGISENAVLQETAKGYLPPADVVNVAPPSVTEETTKILDKAIRK